jgi:23S rRNA pseudouridine1911/1915/1917 synthase
VDFLPPPRGEGGFVKSHHVADRPGERLDRWLAELYPSYNRAHVQDLIKRGKVTVDGKVKAPSYRLKGGEHVAIATQAEAWSDLAFAKSVIREDDQLLVMRKPAGFLTHPMNDSWLNAPGAALESDDPNIAGLLLRHREDTCGRLERCGIVHRLDRQTSGALVVAKTPEALEYMLAAFRDREVEKVYRAVVLGELDRKTLVDAPVGRRPGRKKIEVTPFGREASTEFRTVEAAGGLSLVEAKPKTGRTHQIRVHLSHLGIPVLGDPEAFDAARRKSFAALGVPNPPRMLLHAYRIRFAHPVTGKLVSFTANPPDDFKSYWKSIKDLP